MLLDPRRPHHRAHYTRIVVVVPSNVDGEHQINFLPLTVVERTKGMKIVDDNDNVPINKKKNWKTSSCPQAEMGVFGENSGVVLKTLSLFDVTSAQVERNDK